MEKTLKQKVDTAIKLLRNAEISAQNKERKLVQVNTPAWNTDGGVGCNTLIDNNLVEIAYSGGKDSDVILHLARMAGIKHIAIHKRTTIDPAGTVQHAIDQGAVILNPKKGFFKIIQENGVPTMRFRFCCAYLKEYKVLDTAVHGIRKDESAKRNKLYEEPTICRIYGNKKNKVEVFLPILDWTKKDIKEFVEQEHIQCHKLYYDQDGTFHPEKRLGCIGCPLKGRKQRINDFMEHHGFVKAYIKNAQIWIEKHPEAKRAKKFGNAYNLFLNDLFCNSYEEYLQKYEKNIFQEPSKQLLEQFFNIQLP